MTTQKVIREGINATTLTEAEGVHVEPYKLVNIAFTESLGGNATVGYFSEGQLTSFGGETYQPAAIRVNPFTWQKDGRQTGTITLYNAENNDAIALVLNNRVAGGAIEIYQTYRTTPGNNVPPVLIVKGECSSSDIDPDRGEIKIKVVTQGVNTLYTPNRYFTPSEGFNHIPATGLSITFGNEIFIFERAK